MSASVPTSEPTQFFGADDDDPSLMTSASLQYSLVANFFVFLVVWVLFEFNRKGKKTFLCRVRAAMMHPVKRVPDLPPPYFGGWFVAIMGISEEEVLEMVGLDAYMFLRFNAVCLKVSLFLLGLGFIVLLPVYSTADGGLEGWNKYTIGNLNVSKESDRDRLWATVGFTYVFVLYFFVVYYEEYENFVEKRLQYLAHGDYDTPLKTNYSVTLENLPTELRSVTALRRFLEEIFPGKVESVELPLELDDLESSIQKRREVLHKLEKAVAHLEASTETPRIMLPKRAVDATYAERDRMRQQGDPTGARLGSGTARSDNSAGQPSSDGLGVVPKEGMKRFLNFSQRAEDASDQLKQVLQRSRWLVSDGRGVPSLNRARSASVDSIGPSATSPLVSNGSTGYQSTHHAGSSTDPPTATAEDQDGVDCSSSTLYTVVTQCSCEPMVEVVAIDYYHALLDVLNANITEAQDLYIEQMNAKDALIRQSFSHPGSNADSGPRSMRGGADEVCGTASITTQSAIGADSDDEDVNANQGRANGDVARGKGEDVGAGAEVEGAVERTDGATPLRIVTAGLQYLGTGVKDVTTNIGSGVKDVATIGSDAIASTANEGLKLGISQANNATKGIFKGVAGATKALEMITVGNLFTSSSTAFVTFNNRFAHSSALQMLLSAHYPDLVVGRAFSPADIIWCNVAKPLQVQKARRDLSNFFLALGAILWSTVVSFIQALSNLDSLSDTFPGIKDYEDTFAYTLLNSYLAVVLLLVIIALQPILFDAMYRYYAYSKSESEVQEEVMKHYFYYQVANVYVSIGAGSIFASASEIINNPAQLFTILGTSLPSVSIYFSVLIVVKTFTTLPLEMLRLWPWIQTFLLTTWLDKKKCTRRELRGYFAPPAFLAGWEYPGLLMVYLITLAYASIAPMIQVFSVAFFCMAYIMYKYQFLYVYVTPWQSGGEMWFATFDRSMICLQLSCFALMGYMAIQNEASTITTAPFYAVLVLIFIINFYWSSVNNKFQRICKSLSVESAISLDRVMPDPIASNPSFHIDCNYRQPSLTEPKQEPEPYRGPIKNQGDDYSAAPGASSLEAGLAGDRLEPLLNSEHTMEGGGIRVRSTLVKDIEEDAMANEILL